MPRVRVIGLSAAFVTTAIVGGMVLDAVASAASPAPASTPSAAVDPSRATTPGRAGDRQLSEYCLAFRTALAADLGVSQDQLVAAARKAAGTAIDKFVAEGKLRPAAADRLKKRIDAAPASGCRFLAGWRARLERRLDGAPARRSSSTPSATP